MIFPIRKLYKIHEISIPEYEKKNGAKRWGLYVKKLYIGTALLYMYLRQVHTTVHAGI